MYAVVTIRTKEQHTAHAPVSFDIAISCCAKLSTSSCVRA